MNYNQPLNLPQGSVRAIITILVLAASVVMHVIGQPSAELDAAATVALGAYFGYRVASTSVPLAPPPPPVEEPPVVIQTPEEAEAATTGFVAGQQ
jgi:hypothetical protein